MVENVSWRCSAQRLCRLHNCTDLLDSEHIGGWGSTEGNLKGSACALSRLGGADVLLKHQQCCLHKAFTDAEHEEHIAATSKEL